MYIIVHSRKKKKGMNRRIVPSFGVARNRFGRYCPYAAVIHKSGRNTFSNSSKKSGSFAFLFHRYTFSQKKKGGGCRNTWSETSV